MQAVVGDRIHCVLSRGTLPAARLLRGVDARWIGNYARYPMFGQQCIRARLEPAGMARFAHYRSVMKFPQQVEECPGHRGLFEAQATSGWCRPDESPAAGEISDNLCLTNRRAGADALSAGFREVAGPPIPGDRTAWSTPDDDHCYLFGG